MELLRSKHYTDYCSTHPSTNNPALRTRPQAHKSERVRGGSRRSKAMLIELSGGEGSILRFEDLRDLHTPCQNGCINWASQTCNGYGMFWDGDRTVLAHRFAFALEHGIAPAGMEIHHTCFNRKCVNPEHLECLTIDQHRAIHY